ncbi:MotA/TolQ/ExbB proton channel family protein [bacterium]|nr:MotA/TolQ/ExbB proton channel family protein [bacterium]
MEIFAQFELISKGGPLMIALLICSILSLAIIVERMIYLRRGRIINIDILREIEVAVKKRDFETALEWSEKEQSPMLKIAKVALINAGNSKEELKNYVEEAGRMQILRLERFLTILHTIAVVSPLLGLLGTVTGMIHVFDTIVTHGTGNASVLAGGISEALITTASGLSIAIPTLIFYNFFAKKVENIITEMEHHSVTMVELLCS